MKTVITELPTAILKGEFLFFRFFNKKSGNYLTMYIVHGPFQKKIYIYI